MWDGTMTLSAKSNPSTGDELEARVAQLWFWDGFFARRGINVQYYFYPDPLQLTDLDLLAFDFGPTLQRRRFIGEVKSGTSKNTQAPLDRVIWLRGRMALVDADGAELTTATVPSPRIKELALSLKIRAQSIRDLSQREDRARINEVANLGAQGPEALRTLQRVHSQCKREPDLERAFWFLRSEVWLIDQWLAVKRTITIIDRISKRWIPGLGVEEDFAVRWLLCEAICISAFNLVTIAQHAIGRERGDFEIYVRDKLSEGLVPTHLLVRISDAVDKFIGGVLSQYNVPSSVQVDSLGAFEPTPPAYTDSLVEVCWRLAARPSQAGQVPRLLEFLLFEQMVNVRPIAPQVFNRLGLAASPAVAYLGRLVLMFLNGQADLPGGFTETFLRSSKDLKEGSSLPDEPLAVSDVFQKELPRLP